MKNHCWISMYGPPGSGKSTTVDSVSMPAPERSIYQIGKQLASKRDLEEFFNEDHSAYKLQNTILRNYKSQLLDIKTLLENHDETTIVIEHVNTSLIEDFSKTYHQLGYLSDEEFLGVCKEHRQVRELRNQIIQKFILCKIDSMILDGLSATICVQNIMAREKNKGPVSGIDYQNPLQLWEIIEGVRQKMVQRLALDIDPEEPLIEFLSYIDGDRTFGTKQLNSRIESELNRKTNEKPAGK